MKTPQNDEDSTWLSFWQPTSAVSAWRKHRGRRAGWGWGVGSTGGKGGGRVKEGVMVVSMVRQWSPWLPTEPGSAAPGMCVLFAHGHTHAHGSLFVFFCVCDESCAVLSESPRGVNVYTSAGKKRGVCF